MSFDLSTLDVMSPEHYEQHGYPHGEWAHLRRHAPVFWYERPGFDPFWVVTKHADIVWLSKHPKTLLNAPRLAVFGNDVPPPDREESRHLLNMDPPDHAKYRQVSSKRFTPRAVQGWEPKVRQITRSVIDAAAQREEIDFVKDVSAPITIAVIALMLGVPERDWPLLFRWTNEIIAPEDPEFQRDGDKQKTFDGARLEVFAYFNDLAEQRRRQPSDDIVSEIAHGAVDGRALPPVELLSYLFLLVVAGNETTRNAMTGGMLALIEHPGEWKRLADDPALITPAIEEIVRWTTPVIQFCRTATEDLVLRGQQIRAGQSLCLFYPSANRDEEIFPDGDVFRIDRSPNDHIGFGRGEHVCLGAHLARLEIRAVFEELRARLVRAELASPIARVRSSFVGGIKRVPLRWEIAPRARLNLGRLRLVPLWFHFETRPRSPRADLDRQERAPRAPPPPQAASGAEPPQPERRDPRVPARGGVAAAGRPGVPARRGARAAREGARAAHRGPAARVQERGTALIVVDTNVIAYLWLPGRFTARAEALVERDPEWAAPILWRSEFRSVLAGSLRRGDVDLDTANRLAERAEGHLRGREFAVGSAEVLARVEGSRCSAYDCEFVVLAQELGIPLVTSDRRILADFPETAIALGSG